MNYKKLMGGQRRVKDSRLFGEDGDGPRTLNFINLFEELELTFGGCDAYKNVAQVYVHNKIVNVELDEVNRVVSVYDNRGKNIKEIKRSDFVDSDSFVDAIIQTVRMYGTYVNDSRRVSDDNSKKKYDKVYDLLGNVEIVVDDIDDKNGIIGNAFKEGSLERSGNEWGYIFISKIIDISRDSKTKISISREENRYEVIFYNGQSEYDHSGYQGSVRFYVVKSFDWDAAHALIDYVNRMS